MGFYVYRKGSKIEIAEGGQEMALQLHNSGYELAKHPYQTLGQAQMAQMLWETTRVKWEPSPLPMQDGTWSCRIIAKRLVGGDPESRILSGEHYHPTKEEAIGCADSRIAEFRRPVED